MRDRADILDRLQAQQETMHRLGVKRLGLFGSVARGAGTPQSDLDFLVEFERPSFDAYMDLKFLLERLFQCSVDLVLTDAIKPRLREPILHDAVYVPGL